MNDKFYPLTETEYLEIKNNIEPIKDMLPEHLMGFVWNYYKKISGSNENQPCGCPSAGVHWRKAVTVLREYLNGVQNK